jgi:hypothetical protein
MSAGAPAFRLDLIDDRESPSTGASTSITSFDFGVTLDEIRALLDEDEEQDRPSVEACERTVALLREAAQRLGMTFPRAIAVSGPGASVRLLWIMDQKELRVMIGGSMANRSYLYWRTGSKSGVDERIRPRTPRRIFIVADSRSERIAQDSLCSSPTCSALLLCFAPFLSESG